MSQSPFCCFKSSILFGDVFKNPLPTSYRKIAIFADKQLPLAFLQTFQQHLKGELIVLTAGDATKTIQSQYRLQKLLLKKKFGKDSLLIAVGGGTITDLVGFVASTYMRGIPVIFVPTTLMGMVDAAIGGKNGVNTPYGKNLIGTFYFPKEIWIDFSLLHTLPEKEWQNGLSEIVKYALIHDKRILSLLNQGRASWRVPHSLEKLIAFSIQTKLKIIQKDPFEKGYRRILNFGHTVAHALELLSNYSLSHGEAVVLGLLGESFLSYTLGFLSKSRFLTIETTLLSLFSLPSLPVAFSVPSFLKASCLDKKNIAHTPCFVFIDQIGHPIPFDGTYVLAPSLDPIRFMVGYLKQLTSERTLS